MTRVAVYFFFFLLPFLLIHKQLPAQLPTVHQQSPPEMQNYYNNNDKKKEKSELNAVKMRAAT